jgi:hypothetical protein
MEGHFIHICTYNTQRERERERERKLTLHRVLSHLTPTIKIYPPEYYPHFTDGETEALVSVTDNGSSHHSPSFFHDKKKLLCLLITVI